MLISQLYLLCCGASSFFIPLTCCSSAAALCHCHCGVSHVTMTLSSGPGGHFGHSDESPSAEADPAEISGPGGAPESLEDPGGQNLWH